VHRLAVWKSAPLGPGAWVAGDQKNARSSDVRNCTPGGVHRLSRLSLVMKRSTRASQAHANWDGIRSANRPILRDLCVEARGVPIEGDQQEGPFVDALVLLPESFVGSLHRFDGHFPKSAWT